MKKKSDQTKKEEKEEAQTSNHEKSERWNVGPDREKVCIIFFNMLEIEAKKNEGEHGEEKLVELAGSIEQGLFINNYLLIFIADLCYDHSIYLNFVELFNIHRGVSQRYRDDIRILLANFKVFYFY